MSRILLLLAFLPIYLEAASDTRYAVDTSGLQELYRVISQKTPAENTGSFRWEHRRILFRALGIDSADTNDSAVAVRLRFGWRQLQAVRISKPEEPPVYFNRILHLALHYGYGPLLLDAARWEIDLNEFDPVSHSTLLNYLEDEYRNGTDEQRWEWLREYKQLLQAHGARYCAEIDFRMRILAKKYEKIRPPVDGLYPVRRNGRWGWVTENNTLVIPLKYDVVRYFTRELFEVKRYGSDFIVIGRRPTF